MVPLKVSAKQTRPFPPAVLGLCTVAFPEVCICVLSWRLIKDHLRYGEVLDVVCECCSRRYVAQPSMGEGCGQGRLPGGRF